MPKGVNTKMLEAINLCKTYTPKKSIPVKALNEVSLRFPEKGMVFLLGKSGSGKSTLLNVLGGLDSYDSGEIIIKGVSSKNFKGKHFDSYRNTYVGFIFQNYNVLDEFTVGANIGLALELQGKEATNEAINEILCEVDLEGYGSRRPNELSGGQLQRVAIARALVKKPEIIMADEPTGALDSKTGKQIFDTLKKLSKKTLVIVVSHDREFAEKYADRIIELSDGHILSDVEVASESCNTEEKFENDSKIVFGNETIEISGGYMLTEEDRIMINEYLSALHGNTVKINVNCHTTVEGSGKKTFLPTDSSKIPHQDGSSFNLIKSRLPIKNAIKIGASGLKYKKFRLVMTIFLSVVAFVLFGLSDTFASYNHVKACTDSIMDTEVSYLALEKNIKKERYDGEMYYTPGGKMSGAEIKNLSEEIGHRLKGVYTPTGINMSVASQTDFSHANGSFFGSMLSFSGFINLDSTDIHNMGYNIVAGNLPDGSRDEIAITKCIADLFLKYGFSEHHNQVSSNSEATFENLENYDDLIGKKLFLGNAEYRITGIVDTLFNEEHYNFVLDNKTDEELEAMSNAENIARVILYTELQYEVSYSCVSCAIVGDGFIDRMIDNTPPHSDEFYVSFDTYDFGDDGSWEYNVNGFCQYTARYSDMSNITSKVVWLDGGEDRQLKENEIVVCIDTIYGTRNNGKQYYEFEEMSKEELIDYLKENPNVNTMIENIRNHTITDEKELVIVGYYDLNSSSENSYDELKPFALLSDRLYDSLQGNPDEIYSRAIGVMPRNVAEVQKLVENSVREDTDVRYELENSVTYQLDLVNDALKIVAKVFLYIGIGFAVFAALLMSNFIAISVANKKQEIGILRAIGSRSNDVFRIFFSESFIIAAINFVISSSITAFITFFANSYLREQYNLLITVLHFGIRQISLLFVICIAVATIASYLPVRHIAAKRPIDAIKNR